MQSFTIPNCNNDNDKKSTALSNKKIVKPRNRNNSQSSEPKTKITHVLVIFISLSILTMQVGVLNIGLDNADNNQVRSKNNNTIAYAISLTSCDDPLLADGAAILKHTIHLSSIRNPDSTSKYDYKMYAIVHTQAATETSCIDSLDNLKKMGYELLIRDTPVNVTEIKGKFLRETIVKRGCCQEKELIKLWAYTIIDYPIVVHLDIDTMILQPMDELHDVMIYGPTTSNMNKIRLMFSDLTIPKQIDAYFTRDYNMIKPGKKHWGVQGGFFVIRPNMTVFEEYQSVVLEGHFRGNGGGWGNTGHGGYYGAQQIQGLLPYYYDHLHPDTSLELHRCTYNSMADKTYLKENKIETTKCKTSEETCDDCRRTDVSDMKSAHFTICKKPWRCEWVNDTDVKDVCNALHHEWYRFRKDLEDTWEKENVNFRSNRTGKMKPDHFYGFCTMSGKAGYIPIKFPP